VGGRDTEDLCLDTGHIGIYVSGKCQKELAPKIASWLLEREGEESRAATLSSPGGDEKKPGEKPKRKSSSAGRKKK
jgi:polyhydroxyalkanoate synthase